MSTSVAHSTISALKANRWRESGLDMFSFVTTGAGRSPLDGAGLSRRFSFMLEWDGRLGEDSVEAVDEVERLVLRRSRILGLALKAL
jgi:hypothetical protein